MAAERIITVLRRPPTDQRRCAMEQDATGGQPTEAETQSAPPEEPVSTSPGGPPAAAAEEPAPAASSPAADAPAAGAPGGAAEEHAGGPVEMAKEKLEEVKDK